MIGNMLIHLNSQLAQLFKERFLQEETKRRLLGSQMEWSLNYDHELWEEKMLPNLNKFHLTSPLPEAVSPRHPSGQDNRTNFHIGL